MREYSYGKKVAALVIHQMFLIMMVSCLFTMNYFIRIRLVREGMVYSFLAIVGLVGSFVALAYLTSASGKHSADDPMVHYHVIDRLDGDLMSILFIGLTGFLVSFAFKVHTQEYELSGLLVAVGTIAYLLDMVFMAFYLSVVRRLKGGILLTSTMVCRIYRWVNGILTSRLRREPITRRGREQKRIQQAIEAIVSGALDTTLPSAEFHGREKEIAEAVNHIRDGLREAVDESIRNERMKADLITNVSHDIKTPLTSIVNYVDLLKRENLDNPNAANYIRIIDEKAHRLKQLTEDLVEASKISSGNIELDMQMIDFTELLYQTGGEFNERFEARGLTIVTKLPHKKIMIRADGRQLYRALENLYTNAAKYALEKTRVYVELSEDGKRAFFSIKNISANQIKDQEHATKDLTERFVRGESSRTTEGSGLGLSIAKNLTELMGGEFVLRLDGDLFIATVSFKIA